MAIVLLKSTQKVKLARKLWHLAGAIFPILYFFVAKKTILIVIIITLVLFIIFELIRLSIPKINHWIYRHLGSFLKEKERTTVTGTTTLLLSSLLVVFFFEKPIVIISLFFWVIGDAIAEIVGSRWGKARFWNNKSILGSSAFFISCLLVGFILLKTDIDLNFMVILVGALAATLTELLPIPIDDNLSIAPIAALVMTFFSKYLV